MIETLVIVDPRVVQITEEHVREADRLLAEVWKELPDGTGDKYLSFPDGVAVAIEDGGISEDKMMFHAPFMFPHARVGQDLYVLVTCVPTMEIAYEAITKVQSLRNVGWGVNIDGSLTLDKDNSTSGVDYKRIGLWSREDHLPQAVLEKLGVIENV